MTANRMRDCVGGDVKALGRAHVNKQHMAGQCRVPGSGTCCEISLLSPWQEVLSSLHGQHQEPARDVGKEQSTITVVLVGKFSQPFLRRCLW